MNDKINNNIQVDFASITGMLAASLSLSSTIGQIYGLLYMSTAPVSLNEMVEKLGISKGAASTNVRILESWGAVKKIWVDNTRKDYYEANLDTLRIIMSRVREGISKRLSEVSKRFNSLEEHYNNKLSEVNRENEEFYQNRIDMIKDMYTQLLNLIEYLPIENNGQSNVKET